MDSKIAVIGAGTMGHGIAEVFALGGYCVNLEDFYPEVIERAKREINESLSKLLSSGKITRELYDKTLKTLIIITI
ncbi:3-hydroxyacyl-CoA dehydrogenase NAD-binding domain-containing protein [Acidiplasma cupricumulans]|uniref:3-hydroxyacyl-CoA dehydrogenase NAD-binding domain-containing protein n=1 Tax=Acidiplasma cupricumulans TaxID=312540 RepID=UPI000780F2AC|nr:3-hydroxyacyl-CoA dehydrogenase NAD-binding domain-containing protein [Acidiplasma cupricumulans]